MVWIIAGVLIAMWVLESVTSHNGRIHTYPPRGPRGRVSRLAHLGRLKVYRPSR